MNIQTEVLVETLKDLISDIPWCSCKIFSTQQNTAAFITRDEYSSMFSCKGESIEEYCECILNPLMQPQDNGKVHRPDLVVDDGVDMNFLIH